MPVPIIDRQKGLTRIGEIRIGGEKPERGVGKKLEAFRLTSQHKDIIDQCAGLYGGEPAPWSSPSGDAWQLYTTASALPVLLVVGHSLSQVYELRDGQQCVRRCDGITEQMSDAPCICNAQGKDDCEVITRLMVLLPETGTGLGWQLRSKGENAARELSGAAMIAENFAAGRPFVPATLRLTQRRSIVNGQTVRYVVPVLDLDIVAESQRAALPTGYKPVAELEAAGPTLAEGLADTEGREVTRRPKGQAPIPPQDDVEFGDTPVAVPVDDAPAPKLISAAQRRRLFAIAKTAGIDEPGLREFVKTYTGQESTADIPVDAYEPLCAAIQAQEVTA